MHFHFKRYLGYGLALTMVLILAVILAACSSSPAPTAQAPAPSTSAPATSAPATSPPAGSTAAPAPNAPQRQGASGTLKAINGNTLTLTTMQGSQVTVNVSNTTPIQKTVNGTLADLQQGEFLTVIGSQDATGNITASSISIRPAGQRAPAPSPGTQS